MLGKKKEARTQGGEKKKERKDNNDATKSLGKQQIPGAIT